MKVDELRIIWCALGAYGTNGNVERGLLKEEKKTR